MFTATACYHPATEEVQPLSQDSAGQPGSDLSSCYLSFFFQRAWGRHPSYPPCATAQYLARLQQRWQKRCLPCFLCYKFMARKTCSLFFKHTISSHKYACLNMPLILLVGKYLEANCKKSIKCHEHSQARCNFNLTNVL